MFDTWQVSVVQQEAEAMHRLSNLLDEVMDRLLVSPLDELVQRHQLLRVLRDAPHRLFDVLILLADPGTQTKEQERGLKCRRGEEELPPTAPHTYPLFSCRFSSILKTMILFLSFSARSHRSSFNLPAHRQNMESGTVTRMEAISLHRLLMPSILCKSETPARRVRPRREEKIDTRGKELQSPQ